jgi:hypothetical protein
MQKIRAGCNYYKNIKIVRPAKGREAAALGRGLQKYPKKISRRFGAHRLSLQVEHCQRKKL